MLLLFFFSSRRRHTRFDCDWSSDVCSSDLDRMSTGYHSSRAAEAPGVRVQRLGTTEVDGRVSRLRFEYTIETVDGIRHATEVHELGLFTVEEMLSAFRAASLSAEHESSGLTGRGLYVARIAPGGTNV